MTAPKTATQSNSGSCRFAGLSVYEIANKAAREAKRINGVFQAAKKLPPENVVRTALKKVIGGEAEHPSEEHQTAQE
jgi:hypothetical protein